MKKTIVRIVILIVMIGAVVGGLLWYHHTEMSKLQTQLSEEQSLKKEIEDKLNVSLDENQSLLDKIDELTTETVAVFDAETVEEEVHEIGELATMEYNYTNAAAMDVSKNFKFIDWTIPGTRKTAVITMDGVIKVGIDIKETKISCDEATKTITVDMPEAKILSNELDENSMQVYDEDSGIFTHFTLEDGSSLRQEIKEKAETNAVDNGLLEQAQKNAETMIQYIIEAVPDVKENYTIIFK